MITTVLIVDDEDSILKLLDRFFTAKGFSVRTARTGAEALAVCHQICLDVVLLDLRLPDLSGLEVLEKIKAMSPDTGVIMITGFGDVETAVKAMLLQADHFVLKPVDLVALGAIVNKSLENCRTRSQVEYLRKKVSKLDNPHRLTQIRQPTEVHHAIRLLAENSSSNVLIMGETGTGKGLVATIIHELSDRRGHAFVDINCAGLSSEFLESELFGHEKGAFTDAKTAKKGLLEVADLGSIFLDEVGELSLAVQAKLLKVIEKKTFRRLGGTENHEVDVRIMAATNLNLKKAVAQKKFREDLYYRLNVMPITIAPLRERGEDIIPLAHTFLDEFNKTFGKKISGISAGAEAMLRNYSWPGNIRELKNVIERAVLLADGPLVPAEALPDNLKAIPSARAGAPYHQTLEALERNHIQAVLAACDSNRSQAAQILGIHRSTLIKKIEKFNLAE